MATQNESKDVKIFNSQVMLALMNNIHDNKGEDSIYLRNEHKALRDACEILNKAGPARHIDRVYLKKRISSICGKPAKFALDKRGDTAYRRESWFKQGSEALSVSFLQRVGQEVGQSNLFGCEERPKKPSRPRTQRMASTGIESVKRRELRSRTMSCDAFASDHRTITGMHEIPPSLTIRAH